MDKDVLQQAFNVLGVVRRMDVVDKGDHSLCFVHFERWHLDVPAAAATRQRLLRPQQQDNKETLFYRHPTYGPQRVLFARSRLSLAGAIVS